MLKRVLEPEVMDTFEDALDYDSMDHSEVNRRFAEDFLAAGPNVDEILDLGTGTAQIPIELCRQSPAARIVAIDLSVNMLTLARNNLELAHQVDRVRLELVDAKVLPYAADRFSAVMSNSIVHHIPEPRGALSEAVRVLAPSGMIFVRDLMRPRDDAEVARLVATYAAGCNDHQRRLFDDSLRAGLSLAEIRGLVTALGFPAESVTATSDRHWTWCGRKPPP